MSEGTLHNIVNLISGKFNADNFTKAIQLSRDAGSNIFTNFLKRKRANCLTDEHAVENQPENMVNEFIRLTAIHN